MSSQACSVAAFTPQSVVLISSAADPPPILHQPFVVGPRFSPIVAKIVTQIVSGKFVEFDELLSSNIVLTEPEPQLLFDGRLVLTSGPKKFKRRIEDIATWMEAFSTFMLVLSSYFPHRWKDLSQYQLLILQTQRQFPSRVWLPLPIWSTGPALTFSFSTSTWLVPQSVDRVMSPLAPRSLAVLALRESCAPHPVRPAGLPIVVPAVFWGSPCLLLPWSSI